MAQQLREAELHAEACLGWTGVATRDGVGSPPLEVRHVVGGRERPSPELRTKDDAPDGLPLVVSPACGDGTVDEAVGEAVAARREWARWPTEDRSALLLRAADGLERRVEAIAPAVVREVGKPLAQARGEVRRSAQTLRHFAAALHAVHSRALTDASASVWGVEVLEPAGPVAAICTWNMPLQLTTVKVGAALAAGCPVVMKPSPAAPLSPHALLTALREAGLPAGALSVVHGGQGAGRALAGHRDVRVVSFTGRSATGSAVMREAATGPKKVVLELGGKSANVVFADADQPRAVRGVVSGIVRNQGATCTAGSRVLVERGVLDAFVARLSAALDAVVVGDPFEEGTQMGAAVDDRHAAAIEEAVAGAVRRGARVVPGGRLRADVPGRGGAFLRPCVATGLDADDPLCREELFGPVAVLLPFEGEDEAVALANGSEYGLAAGLWSRDVERLERVWRALDCGTVYVNSYHRIDGIPLVASGRKRSGVGTEGGVRGIEEFMVTKSVHLARGQR